MIENTATGQLIKIDGILNNELLFDTLNTKIVVVDSEQKVIWGNRRFLQFVPDSSPRGKFFYDILGDCAIEGPDFCPFSTVGRTGERTSTTIRTGERYFELNVSPIWSTETNALSCFVIEMRDVTVLTRVDDTLRQLQDMGGRLTEFSKDELTRMSYQDRIELLKSRIETCMRTILRYDIVEFRLLNQRTNELEPLLSFGLLPEATHRLLHAESTGNGITGFVAHNNIPYYCADTLEHPLYIRGALDARSSLTVPLVYQDVVIGTCNVESLKPAAFNDRDLYFLRLFANNVAAAIHTFDLLSFEGEKAASEQLGAILTSVSLPIDKIIRDASAVINQHVGENSEALEHLQNILTGARAIKNEISMVGTKDFFRAAERPNLRGRTILVVDGDEAILRSAHEILEEYQCIVETATDTLTAINMIKSSHYDVILSEIKPPGGMSGYQLMLRLFDLWSEKTIVPLLLMTGFGYDGGHTIVNAKLKGLLGVLFKPFLRDQLLNMVEKVINACGTRDSRGELVSPQTGSGAVASPLTTRPKEGTAVAQGATGFYHKQKVNRFEQWVFPISQFEGEITNETVPDSFDAT